MHGKTKWFHPPVSPVHVGVYEIRGLPGKNYFSRWDGRQWYWGWRSHAMASKESDPRDGYQPSWRGLKEKPE